MQKLLHQRRNQDGTFATGFQTLSLSMSDVGRVFSDAGLMGQDSPKARRGLIPKEHYDLILDSNPETKRLIQSGAVKFGLRGYRQWVDPNSGDTVSGVDYELYVPQVQTYQDPAIIVDEKRINTTSQVVLDLVVHELKRKFAKVAISQGENSKRARRCIAEVALLKGIPAEQAVKECLALLGLIEGTSGTPTVINQSGSQYRVVYEQNRPTQPTPNLQVTNEFDSQFSEALKELDRTMAQMQRMFEQIKSQQMVFQR